MPASISPEYLMFLCGTSRWPPVAAVTRREKFEADGRRVAGSVWRDHMQTAEWGPELAVRGQPLVVYCLQGHNVSQLAAARLRSIGIDAVHIEGGIDAYEAAGGVVLRQEGQDVPRVLDRPTEWVTRERPKIDRIACPWLIRRFIDPLAVFHFVEDIWVKDIAEELGAIPFDIPDVHYSHRGEFCTFDTLLDDFDIGEPGLRHLARIVRGADTARFDLEPQSAGLLALSLGLSALESGDLIQLGKGMDIYDALYGWCRYATAETHNWQVRDEAA